MWSACTLLIQGDVLRQSINEDAVCRTAPNTLGLVIILYKKVCFKESFFVFASLPFLQVCFCDKSLENIYMLWELVKFTKLLRPILANK